MKQINFTMLSRLMLLVVACCFLNLQANAQVSAGDIAMDGSNATFQFNSLFGVWQHTGNGTIEIDCDSKEFFEYTDDGGRLWNYNENAPSRVWKFCPSEKGQLLEIEFTSHDVGSPFGDVEETILYGISAESILGNDFLGVTDNQINIHNGGLIDEWGDAPFLFIPLGETGVPDAPGGGKVAAGCTSTLAADPSDNEAKTGCVAVYFNPQDHAQDGEIGAGWTFKVKCHKRPTKITAPADEAVGSLTLLNGLALCSYQAEYTIGKAELECEDACVTPANNIRVFFSPQPLVGLLGLDDAELDAELITTGVRYQEGGKTFFTPVLDAILNGGGNFNPYTGCWDYYVLYIVDGNCDGEYLDDLRCGRYDEQKVTICPPALACNDDIRLALNSGCVGKITPDMVLEDPCIFDLLNYELELFDANGNKIANNTLTQAHIGTRVKAVVTDKIYAGLVPQYQGNSCWTYIHVEDNWQPYVRDIDHQYIYCAESDGNIDDAYDVWGLPIDKLTSKDVFDNCGNFDLSVSDWKFTSLDCSDYYNYNYATGVYTRTWTLSDPVGSHSQDITRIQYVYVISPSRVFVPYNAHLECGDDTSPEGILANPKLGVDYAGFNYFQPIGRGGKYVSLVGEDHASCGYAITYSDSQQIPLCGGGYKIFRTWQFYNWCGDSPFGIDGVFEFTQVIAVHDTKAPVISCPTTTIELGTSPTRCEAVLTLTNPEVTDNCSDIREIWTDLLDADKNPIASGLGPHTLAPGTYYAKFVATDDCGNVSKACLRKITVEDNDAPVCIVDEYTVVNVDDKNNGSVTICADNLDSGSYDNCELDRIVIKKMADAAAVPFTDCVTLSCDDLFNGELDNAHDPECPGTVNIRFRAYDVNGLFCETMVEVELQDKIAPEITGGPDKTRNCDIKDPYSLFTTPTATDNCSNAIVEMIRETGSFDECGRGAVTRTWEATDACGNKARTSQTITLVHVSDFVVEFPADIEGECVGNNFDFDQSDLKISDDDCERVLVYQNDKVYYGVPDACYKIVRTIEVINWCVYDVVAGPPATDDNTQLSARRFRDGGDGYIKYVQVIKVKDTVEPTIAPQADIVIEDKTAGCEGPATLSIDADDACTGKENLDISYRIELQNGQIQNGTGYTVTRTFPYGKHKISFWVTDGCGNTAELAYYFTIKDAKKPGITCVSFLSSELMPIDTDGDGDVDNGMAEIWAREFVKSYSDNCPTDCDPNDPDTKCFLIDDRTGDDPGNVYGDNNPQSPPASAKTGLTFDCADQGTRLIAVWARDEAGNWDYCTAFLELQNNMGACGDASASISGSIETEDNEMVENVTVEVTGTDMPSALTSFDGAFNFLAPMGGTVTVVPEKDMNPLNGVSTYDLVLISQHILGTKELNSPYKLIAADVNKSGTVSGSDIIAIRKLILNKTTQFPNNTSWRFVDKSFAFANANNPWSTPFPEVININTISTDNAADFIAVKVGDINGDVVANNFLGSKVRNVAGVMTFKATDALIPAGQEYTVDFTSEDIATAKGYQFTMNFDQTALEFVNVKAGALNDLSEANFGLTNLEDGVITTSWNTNGKVAASADDVLFSITFRAISEVKLSSAININSRSVQAEGYDAGLNLLDLAIEFNTGVVVTEGFELFQNSPNPFKSETNIGFNMSEAGAATLTIMDVSGKVLRTIEGDYTKGYNVVTLAKGDLSAAGVLYYQLKTANESATKKMILVK